MMALAGIDSINVLVQIHVRNVEIRRNFLTRNQPLEQIRAGLYISGAIAQDYLLERDPQTADTYRATLQSRRREMNQALGTYSASLAPAQQTSFQALEQEIRSYWQALEPIFHWD